MNLTRRLRYLVIPFLGTLFFSCSKLPKSVGGVASGGSASSKPSTSLIDQDSANALEAAVARRLVTIQNPDGGWSWSAAPEALQSQAAASSTVSPPNQFGVGALGVWVASRSQSISGATEAVSRTLSALMRAPLSPTQRLYAPDLLFLWLEGDASHSPETQSKGELGQIYEKQFLAAINVFNTTSPTDAQVNGLTVGLLDSVGPDQLVAAQRARQIANGRNAGLRAFDWNKRLVLAVLRGDVAYAKAIAELLNSDFANVSSEDEYYFLGLACTIIALAPLKAWNANYGQTIDRAKTELLSRQQSDGWFQYTSSDGKNFNGTVQDEGFVLAALGAIGEFGAANRLLVALQNRRLSNGNFVDTDGTETPEAESELVLGLDALSSAAAAAN